MATLSKLRLTISLEAEMTAPRDLERVSSTIAMTRVMSLLNGTGAGQGNNFWSDERSLDANTNESLDLAGSLVNALGETLTFTKGKLYLFYAPDTNTTVLTIGNVSNGIAAPLGAATQSFQLRPGGIVLFAAPDVTGFAVTADTADLIKVANPAGAAATYGVVIAGVAT